MSSPFGTPDRPFGTPRTTPDGKPPRTGLIIGLVSIPMTILFFPIGLVLGVIAIVTAIRALRKGGPSVVGKSVGGLLAGAASTLIAALCLVFLIGFWPQYRSFIDCQSSAVTIQDKNTCQNEFRGDVEKRLGLPNGSLKRVP